LHKKGNFLEKANSPFKYFVGRKGREKHGLNLRKKKPKKKNKKKKKKKTHPKKTQKQKTKKKKPKKTTKENPKPTPKGGRKGGERSTFQNGKKLKKMKNVKLKMSKA